MIYWTRSASGPSADAFAKTGGELVLKLDFNLANDDYAAYNVHVLNRLPVEVFLVPRAPVSEKIAGLIGEIRTRRPDLVPPRPA